MTNILIVLDPEETEQNALDRLKAIPVSADINFKVDFYLDAVPVMARDADNIDFHIEDKRAWLESLVEPLRERGRRRTERDHIIGVQGPGVGQPQTIDHRGRENAADLEACAGYQSALL